MLTGNAPPLPDAAFAAIVLAGVAVQILTARRLGRWEDWSPAGVRAAALAAGLGACLAVLVAAYVVTARPLSKEDAAPLEFLLFAVPLAALFFGVVVVPLVLLCRLIDWVTHSPVRTALLGLAGFASVAWPFLLWDVCLKIPLAAGVLGACAALLGRWAYRFQRADCEI